MVRIKELEIEGIKAREILDCRLEPTLQVDVWTRGGCLGRADVPCGRSTGTNEAKQIRDGGSRFNGKGMLEAVERVNQIVGPELVGKKITSQREIDETMVNLDGTSDKSRLGGNVITGVSLAVLKTAADALNLPLYRYIGGTNSYTLPIPLLDVIEGGKLASNDLDFQEHQIIPVGAGTFSEAIRMGAEVYSELGRILVKGWGKNSLNVGFEGGYTPPKMKDPRDAFDEILKAISELGYDDKFSLGIDAAASHFYSEESGTYQFMEKELTREELFEYYNDLVKTYPIKSIEDPLHEEDFEGFKKLTEELDIQIVGDDIFVTNTDRLKRGIDIGAGNCLLLKVNQVGTVSEALDAANLAFRNSYNVQVSERSGQTADTWLADLAVGLNSGQIKTGVTRGERTEQYNRLLQIEEELGENAAYADWSVKC